MNTIFFLSVVSMLGMPDSEIRNLPLNDVEAQITREICEASNYQAGGCEAFLDSEFCSLRPELDVCKAFLGLGGATGLPNWNNRNGTGAPSTSWNPPTKPVPEPTSVILFMTAGVLVAGAAVRGSSKK